MKKEIILILSVMILSCKSEAPKNCVINGKMIWSATADYSFVCENGVEGAFNEVKTKYNMGDSLFVTTPKTK